MNGAVKSIREAGVVTTAIRKSYFEGKNFSYIRTWLGEHGIDSHLPIQLESAEIAIVTPLGLPLQIRPLDYNKLGLWGGVMEYGETPEECAIREVREETGIEVSIENLKFVEVNDHFNEYSNGDKAIFHTYRFKLVFDALPEIRIDNESAGVCVVTHESMISRVIEHQRDFVKRVLTEK